MFIGQSVMNTKKALSFTPLNCVRNSFIFALNDSEAAFVEQHLKPLPKTKRFDWQNLFRSRLRQARLTVAGHGTQVHDTVTKQKRHPSPRTRRESHRRNGSQRQRLRDAVGKLQRYSQTYHHHSGRYPIGHGQRRQTDLRTRLFMGGKEIDTQRIQPV